MARSDLTNPSNDIITDSGAVLWSFIMGEKLEFPIEVKFLDNITTGYSFEAVVIEAENIEGQNSQPERVLSGGVETTLTTRVPNYQGTWNAGSAYNYEDVVLYSVDGLYYKLNKGSARVDPTTPDVDPFWDETTLNILHVQFPPTLGTDWAISPQVASPVYGFFELQVTETSNPIYARIWKPMRGMVEIRFSPTEVVV